MLLPVDNTRFNRFDNIVHRHDGVYVDAKFFLRLTDSRKLAIERLFPAVSLLPL